MSNPVEIYEGQSLLKGSGGNGRRGKITHDEFTVHTACFSLLRTPFRGSSCLGGGQLESQSQRDVLCSIWLRMPSPWQILTGPVRDVPIDPGALPRGLLSLSEAGRKGAGHSLWQKDIANISWLESDGFKTAVKSTLARTWSSVYTHPNTLES